MSAHENNDDFTAADLDRLEQELLELHFGCHEDPETLQARLDRDPALRALQQEVVRKAEMLERASRPVQAPLVLPDPAVAGRAKVMGQMPWYLRPVGRMTGAAAAVLLVVIGCLGKWGIDAWRFRSAQRGCVQMTVSGPKAVPVGAPWSFTVQTSDLRNEPVACAVHWKAFAQDGGLIAHQDDVQCPGSTTITMPASMQVPRTIAIESLQGQGTLRSVLEMSSERAAPLVHATTDKPVYRPGEPVFVRAVVLDRVTLSPQVAITALSVRVLDPKGAPVAQQWGINATPQHSNVGAFVWQVPAESAGGEYQVEIGSHDGSFPKEQIAFVVRSYQPPRLHKDLVLDRKTYSPGQRGSAEVKVERMAGGVAAGAAVRAALVLDGSEVWTEDGVLDESGRAVFRFAVPQEVKEGSARFVARVTDGGVVETEVKPFVVPTGKVLVAAFPEGGELVAGVSNRVYLEVTDPLGRPVDTEGVIIDGMGREVAAFRTEHQGRGRCEFTPMRGVEYRARPTASKTAETFALPEVTENGIALRLLGGDGIAAGAPARARIAGSGTGPWLVGAFCRGVLLAQSTVRSEGGRVDQEVSLDLPVEACGVLRVTVFDRQLQPVAERLVQRAAQHQVRIEITPERAVMSPGGKQRVAIKTRDERGNVIPAVLGVAVTDRAAIAMGSEPRVGLLDQTLLFADVERGEDLGDFFAGGEHSPRNADLVLGTRGWRRFVWRNDASAHSAIAAHGDWAKGVLAREGFSHTPQAKSNRVGDVDVGALAYANTSSRNRTTAALCLGGLFLGLLLLGECLAFAARRSGGGTLVQVSTAAGGCLGILFVIATSMTSIIGARAPAAGFELFAVDGAAAPLPREAAGMLPFDLGAGGWQDPAAAFGERLHWKDGFVAAPAREPAVVDRMEVPRLMDQDIAAADLMELGEQLKAVDAKPAARAKRREGGFRGWIADEKAAERALFGYLATRQPVREYAHAHQATAGDERRDFTETVYWNPLLVTDPTGNATFTFDVSDSVTTWVVQADAHATGNGAGRVGQAQASFDSRLPFHLEAKLPVELTAGDHLQLPVAVTLEDGDGDSASVNVGLSGPLTLEGAAAMQIKLNNGRGRALIGVTASTETGVASLQLQGKASRFQDRIAQQITVAPRGFPHGRSWGGTVAAGTPSHTAIPFPRELVPGSGKFTLKVFPSPLSALREGLDGMLREPCGCFEQASSSNYPNTMVLSYVEATGDDLPKVVARARDLLPKGYQRIAGYECKQKGYEWFGGDPGHEALTAYGLLEFTDMKKVHEVDAAMVARTRDWLLSRRDGKGGFQRNARALDSFGAAPPSVTDPYLVYALLYSGTPPAELAKELDVLAARIGNCGDAYELALIACAMHEAKRPEAAAARQRLLPMQNSKDGSLRGATRSITSSGGDDLAVETTSFAILAWLPDAALSGNVRSAVEYLQSKKSARGTFGATQATIMALKALTAYAELTRGMKAPGTLRVLIDDKLVATKAFAAGSPDALTFDLVASLKPGDNELRLELEGGGTALPWACDLVYHADQPADDPDGKVGLSTKLGAKVVEEGRTVALEVTVSNRTREGLPMTLAIIGLPAGLELPTRVLEDLIKAQAFDLWELRGRELVLYWRGFAPEAEKKVTLDLVARIPGTSTGPASRSYLYYTPDQKRWAAPVQIEVTALR